MRTQEAFTIPLLDCAKRLNLKFSRHYTNREGQIEHVFHNPLRKDKIASLYINPTKNVAYDNGGIIDGGGIIWLVNYLYGNPLKDTSGALKILDSLYPELKHPSKRRGGQPRRLGEVTGTLPLFTNPDNPKNKIAPAEGYDKKEKKPNTFALVKTKELYSYPLKNYLKDDRKINLDIAKHYVKEVIYKHVEKNIDFYGVGFQCGKTWVIRRKGFKGFLGKGADITILNNKSSKALIFEGFIDFLSYLTITNIKKTTETVIILNSAVFIKRAIEFINDNPNIKAIDYYRDNDEAGLESLKRLETSLNHAIIRDKSDTYPNHKDLNEYLTNGH